MVWKLSTAVKKNVTQVEDWVKGDLKFTRTIGWRWGSAFYDEKPEIEDLGSPDGEVEIYGLGDVVDTELGDGCWEEIEYGNGITVEEQIEIEKALYDGEVDIEDLGWDCDDSEIFFQGPLELEEVE